MVESVFDQTLRGADVNHKIVSAPFAHELGVANKHASGLLAATRAVND